MVRWHEWCPIGCPSPSVLHPYASFLSQTRRGPADRPRPDRILHGLAQSQPDGRRNDRSHTRAAVTPAFQQLSRKRIGSWMRRHATSRNCSPLRKVPPGSSNTPRCGIPSRVRINCRPLWTAFPTGTFAPKQYIWSPRRLCRMGATTSRGVEAVAGGRSRRFPGTSSACSPMALRRPDPGKSAVVSNAEQGAARCLAARSSRIAHRRVRPARGGGKFQRHSSGNVPRRGSPRHRAHLAAKRQRGDPSIAEAALRPSADARPRPLRRLMPSRRIPPGTASWLRALRLRNTNNWKAVEADSTVLMEAVEMFRARSCAVSTGFALQGIAKLKPAPVPDWRRVVLEFNVGIGEGHQFAKESMQAELAGLREDWKACFGRELPEHEAIKALNEPAGRAVMRIGAGTPAIGVLGWDFWSAQHQRHFCQSIRATNRFYRDVWGWTNFAKCRNSPKLNFADLTLFPLLERGWARTPHDLADINRRVAALIASHPELVDFSEWAGLNNASGPLPALELESPGLWYNPHLPFGTFHMVTASGPLPSTCHLLKTRGGMRFSPSRRTTLRYSVRADLEPTATPHSAQSRGDQRSLLPAAVLQSPGAAPYRRRAESGLQRLSRDDATDLRHRSELLFRIREVVCGPKER